MTNLTEGAFAKVNLTLDILGKRGDGYHNLKSVMQAISLHDDVLITLDTGRDWELHCFWEIPPEQTGDAPPESEIVTQGLPQGEENIAWKAARLYLERIGRTPDGLEIRINKRIPMQAGLGGGSTDAAAVLRALNRHFGAPLSLPALAELGAQVGSDVPFCVLGGTALVEGRGELLTQIPCEAKLYYAVCKPEFGVSTRELYDAIDAQTIIRRPDLTSMRANLQKGDYQGIGGSLMNVFEPLVMERHLEINYIKSVLFTYGAYGAQMTGSGSAVFGIFDSFEYATVACTMLKDRFSQIYLATNV